MSLTKTDQLRREDVCSTSSDSSTVMLSHCGYSDKNNKWKHEKVRNNVKMNDKYIASFL